MPSPRHPSCHQAAGLVLLLCLFSTLALADQTLRVVTWNVESIGAQGSAEYNAARDVLQRIGADVVAVQEIGSDADAANLLNLASDLHYNYATVATGGPFGSDRAAFMSDLILLADTAWTAAQLSGDPAANDLTRYILEAEIDVTGQGDVMNLVVNHWKSGGANADEYRRAIETQRMAQVVARMAADTPFVLMGDVNADVRDGSPTPSVFTAEPTADLPTDFVTGADIRAQFLTGGLPNDPFPTLANLARMLDAIESILPAVRAVRHRRRVLGRCVGLARDFIAVDGLLTVDALTGTTIDGRGVRILAVGAIYPLVALAERCVYPIFCQVKCQPDWTTTGRPWKNSANRR